MSHIIYPGSFDPITNGHVDVIQRLKKNFDKVTVLVASTPQKKSLFSIDERKKLIEDIFDGKNGIEVDVWDGLLIDYLEKRKCFLVGKGLRSVRDFEYEMDMAYTNQALNKKVDTFFVLTQPNLGFISSTLVKEVASFGGDISKFVPASVAKSIQKKFK